MDLQRTRAMWDREAAAFDEEPDHGLRDPATRAAWRELLLPHLPAPPASRTSAAAPAPCRCCSPRRATVDGVDLSGEMVDAARRKAATADLA